MPNWIKLCLASAALVLGCAGTCEPGLPPPTDPTAIDAGPEPQPPADAAAGRLPPEEGASGCERACNRLRRLKCPGGEGSPSGASCEQVCENQDRSGIGSFCTAYVMEIQGTLLPSGERECDEDELQRAFEACE